MYLYVHTHVRIVCFQHFLCFLFPPLPLFLSLSLSRLPRCFPSIIEGGIRKALTTSKDAFQSTFSPMSKDGYIYIYIDIYTVFRIDIYTVFYIDVYNVFNIDIYTVL